MAIVEVVVENGYMIHGLQDGLSFDGDTQQECGVHVEPTMGTMHLDGQLTQEQLHSTPMAVDDSRRFSVGCISNDFDVNEFEREEEEEDRIGDVVSSDSDDLDDDQGGRDAMPTPVDAMPVLVHAMLLAAPTEVLYAMPAQGRLVIDLSEDDTPYDLWARISEAQQYVPPPPYTSIELMQLRSMNVPFSDVLNYRDVSMMDMAVCDTDL